MAITLLKTRMHIEATCDQCGDDCCLAPPLTDESVDVTVERVLARVGWRVRSSASTPPDEWLVDCGVCMRHSEEPSRAT